MTNYLDRHIPKYTKLLASGVSQEKIARVMVTDERDALEAAECDIDDHSRERIRRVVEYGAKELGLAPPRVRYFDSKGLSFSGIHFRDWPNEVWVAADRPPQELKRLALHELAHAQQYADGAGADLPRDERLELNERDADRFSRRGINW